MSHGNIALFLPHIGCPHQCSFCNQHRITGQQSTLSPEDVTHAVTTSLSHNPKGRELEIAFFGGSFTAVPRALQESLLQAAQPFVRSGDVKGVRISTRPDCIDGEILSFLKGYGVTAIELGAQSMVDRVLEGNRRGHTAEQVAKSAGLIRSASISLGLQMMTGMDYSTPDDDRETAKKLCDLQPDTMRIYPTVVMEDTPLAQRYRSGDYVPMSLDDSVSLCGELLDLFEDHHIAVIRLGLHSSEELRHCLAGPYHPAFAELCYSRRFLQQLKGYLAENGVEKGPIAVGVHPRFLSKAIGQKKENLRALLSLGYSCTFFSDSNIADGAFSIEKGGNPCG